MEQVSHRHNLRSSFPRTSLWLLRLETWTTHTYIYIYTYIYTCKCTYIYIYIFIFSHERKPYDLVLALRMEPSRTGWERTLFGDSYEDAKPFDRCKYGALNVTNDYRGAGRDQVWPGELGRCDENLALQVLRLPCSTVIPTWSWKTWGWVDSQGLVISLSPDLMIRFGHG